MTYLNFYHTMALFVNFRREIEVIPKDPFMIGNLVSVHKLTFSKKVVIPAEAGIQGSR